MRVGRTTGTVGGVFPVEAGGFESAGQGMAVPLEEMTADMGARALVTGRPSVAPTRPVSCPPVVDPSTDPTAGVIHT